MLIKAVGVTEAMFAGVCCIMSEPACKPACITSVQLELCDAPFGVTTPPCLQGVLAMSWSGHDAGLLLSSAKDNRTILWDVATGETLGELSAGDNWDFDVLWSPSNPGVFATSSYGAGEGSSGKVSMPSAALEQLRLPSVTAFQLLVLPIMLSLDVAATCCKFCM